MTRTIARILLPLSFALAACSSDTTVDDDPSVEELVTIEAGIAGTVRWVTYGPDDGVEDSGPVEGEEIAVFVDQDPGELVDTVVTDEYGFFELELPDGSYVLSRSEGTSASFVIESNVVACRNSTNPGLGPEWECGAL
jgi:hypothetical protein